MYKKKCLERLRQITFSDSYDLKNSSEMNKILNTWLLNTLRLIRKNG